MNKRQFDEAYRQARILNRDKTPTEGGSWVRGFSAQYEGLDGNNVMQCLIAAKYYTDPYQPNMRTARGYLENLYGGITRPYDFTEDMTDEEVLVLMRQSGRYWSPSRKCWRGGAPMTIRDDFPPYKSE